MTQAQITIEAYNAALNAAEARWYANRDAKTIAAGIEKSDDIKDARKWLTAKTVEFINANLAGMNLKPEQLLNAVANDLGVKAQKRMIEFFNAIHAGEYRKLDGVTALSVLSSVHAGAKTREAIHFASTGKGDENTSDQVKNIALVRKLQRALGQVGASTEPTQCSRSFGKNGFCKAINLAMIGRTDKGEKEFMTNTDNVLFGILTKMIETATDTTLETIKGGTGSKRSKK